MTDLQRLKKKILLIYLAGIPAFALMLFLPAGSLDYWQAWLVMGTVFAPSALVVTYFLKHDPALLQRRLQFKEKEMRQKLIIKVAGVVFFIGMLIPGFDYRYGWSQVPGWLVITADILMLAGYLLVFIVFKTNSYASRIIEVQKGQKVISTGPYAVIRHPMYAGSIIMYLAMPLALGSYWALLCFIPIIPILVLRTLNEEEVLKKGLEGYKKYCKKVKYRIIPGIW